MSENIYLTSDLHLNHKLVTGLRGFVIPEEHDAALESNWRRVVRPQDHVFVLGDIAFGGWRDGFARLAAWPGVKHLILGNHDRMHPSMPNAHRYLAEAMSAFDSVAIAGALKNPRVLLSHFPYNGDHYDADRFDQWRLRDLGVPLVHGHTHSSEQLSWSDNGTVQVNVALEAWEMELVPVERVRELIAAGR